MSQWNSYLEHFGIFGMKWGIRRFQNEDGSLTEEGKKRYNRRKEDIESAKEYAQIKITTDKEQRNFWQKNADAIRKMPATKSRLMKEFKISESDYEDAIKIFGSAEKYKKYEVDYYQHEADIYSGRIRDWTKKIDELGKIKVDAISSDQEHMRKVEDIFSQSKGWLFRNLDLQGLRSHIDAKRIINKAHNDVEKQSNYEKEILPKNLKNIERTIQKYKKDHPNTVLSDREIILNQYGYVPNYFDKATHKPTLTQRFKNASKADPNLTYDRIYKEMKVNMSSDDPDVYKEAEDRWLRKHGY